jgi:F-type H+-transporting ATPase subunit epsilon
MSSLHIEIITPSRTAYKGEAQSITLPGTLGNFQVLFNHAPLLSTLEIGRINIEESENKRIEFAAGGGTVEVRNNKVLVLVDSIEAKSDIDVERAKKSYIRAKERLSMKSRSDIDETRAEASLRRAINRLKMAGANY